MMNIKYNEIQELLRSRADLHARLNLMPYDGTPEIKERGDGKYLYVRKRVASKLTSEANLAYKDIYSIAKKSVYIVDNYIGVKTLVLLKDVPSSVEVIIFSDNIGKGLHTLEYQDFCEEYPFRKITFQKSGREFHDRYIIIDWNNENQRIYHCGASSKDVGQRITSITEVVDQMIYTDLINNLLKNPALKLK